MVPSQETADSGEKVALPYLCARTADVEQGLFLRKFGVPFWALAQLYGRDPMFWYRQECALGRASIVGTTVRRCPLPKHLLADEHHQKRDGLKTYLATTVAQGCLLGVEPCDSADGAALQTAYGVFKQEAQDVQTGRDGSCRRRASCAR